jgi:Flp pilus assembly protein CpaB
MAKAWRILAAVIILAVLGGAAVWLAPAYARHYRFQRAMDAVLAEPGLASRPVEAIQVAVAARAASLGIPVKPEQVRVEWRGGRWEAEVRYAVRVDLPLYTVDLHFRAHSRGR